MNHLTQQSLFTGLIASDETNCDEAKAAGEERRKSHDGICKEERVIPKLIQKCAC